MAPCHVNRRKLAKLRCMYRMVLDWQCDEQRFQFLRGFYDLCKDWHALLPDLRFVFRPGELERLMQDALRVRPRDEINLEGHRIIEFVAKAGYKDEPVVLDEATGKPLERRATPIHRACRYKSPNATLMIRELFKIYDDFEVNYEDRLGLTHLHVACMHGLDDVVAQLLDKGHDPNRAWDEIGEPPLQLALRPVSRSKETFELLLRRGANPNLRNRAGLTVMHELCGAEHANRQDGHELLGAVFLLTQTRHRPVQVDARDDYGRTPLYRALSRRSYRLIEILMSQGADPLEANEYGETSLHLLCRIKCHDEATTKMVLDVVGLIEAAPRQPRWWQRAVEGRNYLGNTALHVACYSSNNERLITWLLDRGAEVNAANRQGRRPLHRICLSPFNSAGIARHLIDACAAMGKPLELEALDEWGRTPLLTAANEGNAAMLELLLQAGADPNSIDKDGQTTLHLICNSRLPGRLEMAELLFKNCRVAHHPVKIDARDKGGRTPLHFAVLNDQDGLVGMLLGNDLRADPNAASSVRGATPLHLLCAKHALRDDDEDDDLVETVFRDKPRTRMVQLDVKNLVSERRFKSMARSLLRRLATAVHARDADGSTPLHVLCKRPYNDDAAHLLLDIEHEERSIRACVDVRDGQGMTPLQLAVMNAWPETVAALLWNGADLASFVLPDLERFAERLDPIFSESARRNCRLMQASRTLMVFEVLKRNGYEMRRRDASIVMRVLVEYGMLRKSAEPDEAWRADEDFTRESKLIRTRAGLSLHDLLRLDAKRAAVKVAYEDYFGMARTRRFARLSPQEAREACALHLCEKMSRGFFELWASRPLALLLTRNRLVREIEILISETIMGSLTNEDLCNFCLAFTGR